MEALAERRRVGVGQVLEARADGVGVRAEERRPAGHVDVVADDHERPGAEASGRGRRRRWSGRSSARPRRPMSRTGWTTRPGSLPSYMWSRPWSMTTGHAVEVAEEQAADVARRGRGRPAGQVREGDRDGVRRGRRPGRRAPSPRTMPTRGTRSLRARTAASSASRRAGWSAGAIGRPRVEGHRRQRSGRRRGAGVAGGGWPAVPAAVLATAVRPSPGEANDPSRRPERQVASGRRRITGRTCGRFRHPVKVSGPAGRPRCAALASR